MMPKRLANRHIRSLSNDRRVTQLVTWKSGTHHDHIVCEQCGRVEEFVDQTIEQHQHAIAKKQGFEISDHSLIIYGSCTREHCPHRDAN